MPSPRNSTPAQRSLAGSIRANERWAKATREERHANAARARRNSPAELAYWETKIDPDGHLDAEERARRASNAKRAYFQRLALASSRARARGGDAA